MKTNTPFSQTLKTTGRKKEKEGEKKTEQKCVEAKEQRIPTETYCGRV